MIKNKHTSAAGRRLRLVQTPLHRQDHRDLARRFREILLRPKASGNVPSIVSLCAQLSVQWCAIAWASTWPSATASHPLLSTTRPCGYPDPTIRPIAPCIALVFSVLTMTRPAPID